MNATAESFCVVVVCWYKKKANEKKGQKKAGKRDLSEPLFALFCPIDRF